MFKLDMDAIRKNANDPRLMANPANLANYQPENADPVPEISQLAKLAISHDLITARLLVAAMRRCDQFNDNEQARQDMRDQILETPPDQRQDLLDYFESVAPTLH